MLLGVGAASPVLVFILHWLLVRANGAAPLLDAITGVGSLAAQGLYSPTH